jgi:2-polyprenyl-3-methyl-5-hydroxy-6-metoxy-1,4-benzoquinol methylase
MIPNHHVSLAHVVQRQLAAFPDHRSFMEKRFAEMSADDFGFAEEIAQRIVQIAGDALDRVCADYRWLTELFVAEELQFRRNGRYRLTTFDEANREVYSNRPLMTRYMNGLLVTQLWWRNHTDILRFYHDRFVPGNANGFSHLEVGPGHGLFLAMAAQSPNCGKAEGWDVSEASIANTRAALDAMGVGANIVLRKCDLLAAPTAQFTSITFSEVLEHLERPEEALDILYELLADGGRIFINAPVNSPAPDHLYLFSAPEEVVEMVAKAGFTIEQTLFAPCTGFSLERARQLKVTISAGVMGRK